MKLICKIVGNMGTNRGKYDHDILIRLNLRNSKINVLDKQDVCSIPLKLGFSLSNNTAPCYPVPDLPCWLSPVGNLHKYISLVLMMVISRGKLE